MEVIRGWGHKAFPIGDASRVGEVRRHVAQLAAAQGWTDTDAGRLAIVATELATNLLRHAREGQMWVALRAPFDEIEVIAVDRGPGIENVTEAMRDGASTRQDSAGTGLGALARLADDFDLLSSPAGTIGVARVRPVGAARTVLSRKLGAVCLAVPPEPVSGDAWALSEDGGQSTVIVADGLGHGVLAAEAAQAALGAFAEVPSEPLDRVLHRCHGALQGTRGAAVLAVRTLADALQSCGAGNVAARVFTGLGERSLMGQHGTVGLQIPTLLVSSQERPQHSALIMYTDGITTRWQTKDYAGLLARDATLLAAAILWHNTRSRDDATVIVLQAEEAL